MATQDRCPSVRRGSIPFHSKSSEAPLVQMTGHSNKTSTHQLLPSLVEDENSPSLSDERSASMSSDGKPLQAVDVAIEHSQATTKTKHSKHKRKNKHSRTPGNEMSRNVANSNNSSQGRHSEETSHARPRQDTDHSPLLRFKKFACQIKNQIMWKKGLERAEEHLKTVVPTSFDSQTDTLTFNVNAFKPEIQSYGALSLRAKAILMQPSFNRSEEELKFIHQFTVRLKCFDRYPIYVRKELARVLYYESFEKGRVVIRQGDIGFNFYFILSGSVLVEMQEEDQKTGKKHNMIIGELGAGAAFGELALLHDDRRRATIVCHENCEFLKIDKPDFDEVLKKNYEREWKNRMHHLKEHPIFQKWSLGNLHYAVESSHLIEYPPNTLVLKDLKTPSDKVFFIVKGTCNVVQKVYLSESIENSTHIQLLHRKRKEKLALPPIPGVEKENSEPKIYPWQRQSRYGPISFGVTRRVKRWWIIRTLHPGDYFGVGEGQEGMSIISNQKVELLLVNKMVFKKQDRGKVLGVMQSEAKELYPSLQTALRSYIVTKKWRAYKRMLVIEAAKKQRGGTKATFSNSL